MHKTYDELKEWVEQKQLQKRIDKLAKKYKGKKVLLYGAGTLASVIFDNYDLSGLDIIKVADMKFYSEDEKFNNIEAISPYDIKEFDFDVILVAIYLDTPVIEFLEDEVIEEMDKKIKIESIVKKSFMEKFQELINS